MSPRSFPAIRSNQGGRSRRAAWGSALGATALVLTWASVAGAHIHPEPGSVAAGEQVTVGFGVEHGCGDSPTTKVAFSVPAEVTGATGVAKAGWTIDNSAKVVTFTGGELDAHTAETFELRFTAPTAPGEVHFPIVQTCTEGELAWITIAKEGESEPDYPAPVLEVTAGAGSPTSVAVPAGQSSSTTAHSHDEEGDDHDHDHAEEGASTASTASTDDAAGSEVAAAAQDAGSDGGDGSDDGGSSTLPMVLGLGAGGAALGAVAVIARRKR